MPRLLLPVLAAALLAAPAPAHQTPTKQPTAVGGAGSARVARPGVMTLADLAGYAAVDRDPTAIGYRGLEIYGMGPPSSGGSTVGEILNILEGYDMGSL